MDMNFEKCERKQREKDIENILFLLDVAEMKCIEMFVGTAIKKAVEEWEKKN